MIDSSWRIGPCDTNKIDREFTTRLVGWEWIVNIMLVGYNLVSILQALRFAYGTHLIGFRCAVSACLALNSFPHSCAPKLTPKAGHISRKITGPFQP